MKKDPVGNKNPQTYFHCPHGWISDQEDNLPFSTDERTSINKRHSCFKACFCWESDEVVRLVWTTTVDGRTYWEAGGPLRRTGASCVKRAGCCVSFQVLDWNLYSPPPPSSLRYTGTPLSTPSPRECTGYLQLYTGHLWRHIGLLRWRCTGWLCWHTGFHLLVIVLLGVWFLQHSVPFSSL